MEKTNIAASFRGQAIGATVAMLPITVLFLLIVTKAIRFYDPDDSTLKALVAAQTLGCLTWAICALTSMSGLKKREIPATPVILIAIGAFIGGAIQFICAFDRKLLYDMLDVLYDSDGFGLAIVFALIANLPILIGCNMLNDRLNGMSTARNGFSILAVYPILLLLFSKLIGNSIHSAKTAETIALIFVLVFLIAEILVVAGFWRAASSAKEIDNEGADDDSSMITTDVPVYVEQTVATNPTPASQAYQQPASGIPAANGTVTDGQRKLLMSMSDVELQRIVDNPALYANAAYVAEAANMLTKRRAWEEIKDMTDEQLMSILHENVQGYAPEVLDAASMELFVRESPLFIEEMNALSNEELQGILSNPQGYFDGDLKAAAKIWEYRQQPKE